MPAGKPGTVRRDRDVVAGQVVMNVFFRHRIRVDAGVVVELEIAGCGVERFLPKLRELGERFSDIGGPLLVLGDEHPIGAAAREGLVVNVFLDEGGESRILVHPGANTVLQLPNLRAPVFVTERDALSQVRLPLEELGISRPARTICTGIGRPSRGRLRHGLSR